jgi:hypothetical protein
MMAAHRTQLSSKRRISPCGFADGGRVSRSSPGAVIHKNVAVIACDTPATLQETLHRIDTLEIDVVSIGDRHFMLPASQAAAVLACLREHGQFPRLVGDASSLLGAEEPAVIDADAAEVE